MFLAFTLLRCKGKHFESRSSVGEFVVFVSFLQFCIRYSSVL